MQNRTYKWIQPGGLWSPHHPGANCCMHSHTQITYNPPPTAIQEYHCKTHKNILAQKWLSLLQCSCMEMTYARTTALPDLPLYVCMSQCIHADASGGGACCCPCVLGGLGGRQNNTNQDQLHFQWKGLFPNLPQIKGCVNGQHRACFDELQSTLPTTTFIYLFFF